MRKLTKFKGDNSKVSEDIAPKRREILRIFVFWGARSWKERKRKNERRVRREQLFRARLLSGVSLLTESLGRAGSTNTLCHNGYQNRVQRTK